MIVFNAVDASLDLESSILHIRSSRYFGDSYSPQLTFMLYFLSKFGEHYHIVKIRIQIFVSI